MHSDIFLVVLLTSGEAVFPLWLDGYSDSQVAIMQATISGFGRLLQWFSVGDIFVLSVAEGLISDPSFIMR